jgi:transposase-like protein
MQKKYSKEFKREAVRLMVVDGLSGVEVSKK